MTTRRMRLAAAAAMIGALAACAPAEGAPTSGRSATAVGPVAGPAAGGSARITAIDEIASGLDMPRA